MSTINERWNIVDTTRAFCQKVLPLVYDESLSYMEMVCKMSSKLNEVIENNNNLPQYVKELIKETVNSDDFRQIVGSVLMDTIINVKFPPEGITPAKGDGVTDDTSSIQACFDYANNQGGAVVFFPSGKYLTGTLSINTETSILGADRYNTSLVLKGGGNTPLLLGVINQSVRNICLDGNRLNQVEENYLIDGTIDRALFDNVILCDSAHCITAGTCNNSEFCNIMCKDIGDEVFITAAGNNNLLANINTDYAINLTGNNNNWQSQQQTKIDNVKPLIYQQPQKINDNYSFIPAIGLNNEEYKILVEGEKGIGSVLFDSPEEYGAIGDGINDDTQAFIEMFASDKTHIFNKNKKYLITPSNIAIKNSVNFNNCTLVINNDDTKNNVFILETPENNITITETSITNKGVSNSNLFGMSFFLKSPICLGTGIIDNQLKYHSQLMVTDENGNFINTPYYPNIIAGSYECSNIQPATVKNITMENLNIVYKNPVIKNRFIHVTRNNFTLKNVVVDGSNSTNLVTEIFVIANCYNIAVENLIGNSFNSGSYSYLLALYNVSDVTINKLINNNFEVWHEIGGSYLSNVSIKNSIIKAYDSHYENFGYISVEDTTLTAIQLGNGYFNLNVNNCNHIGNNNLAFFRRDTTFFCEGTLNFKNCSGELNYLTIYYVEDSNFNMEALNLGKLYINLENIKFSGYMFSFMNIPSIYNIILYAKNCQYKNNSANATKQNLEVFFDNCISLYSGNNYNCYANRVTITNTTFNNVVAFSNCDEVKIINSSFPDVYMPDTSVKSVIIANCFVTNDANIIYHLTNANNYAASGNTITAETKNNIENVNGVK